MELDKEPSIGISYTIELPGKKALVMQSFVGRDCDAKELNATLDKIRVASDRQFAFGALQQLRLQLEQEHKIAADHAGRMAQVDENIKRDWANRKGDVKLSKREEEAQQQAYQHSEACKERIAKVRKDIAEYEAMIGA